MVTAMLGSDTEIKLFKNIKSVKSYLDNCNPSFPSGHAKYAPVNTSVDASIKYNVTPDVSGIVYCYFPSRYPREVKLHVDGSSYGTYFGNETQRIVSLGNRTANTAFEVELTLTKSELYIMSGEKYFWYLDEEVYNEVMPKLVEGNMNIEKYTERYFEGTVTTKDDFSTVFTTLPYDEGWQVFVDGERVEIFKSLDALIAFEIDGTAGEHDIVLKYSPNAFTYGLIITLAGTFVLLMIVIFDKHLRRLLGKIFPADRYPDGNGADIDVNDAEDTKADQTAEGTTNTPTETTVIHEAGENTEERPAIIPDDEVLK